MNFSIFSNTIRALNEKFFTIYAFKNIIFGDNKYIDNFRSPSYFYFE